MNGASVLVIRLSSLGDVLLTTPALAGLRAAHPAGRISVLTRGAFAPLFQANPNVDEVLRFEERGFWGWAAEIRRRRFTVVVDLHGTARSRLWSLMSGAPRRVRYRKRAWARRALVWFKRPSPSLAGTTVDRYLETLGKLGIPAPRRDPALYFSPGESLSQEWSGRLGPGPFVAVAPGALHATKRWPPEYFARAADQAAESLAGPAGRLPIVLLGAPADVPAVEETLRHLHGPAQSLAGQTSLREMMLILKRCAVLLTNDSGAMHVAAALGVPTVALFGPTVEAFGFFPAGGRVRVLERRELACRPCSLHGTERCPRGHFKCMREIEPEAAARAAVGLARGGDA